MVGTRNSQKAEIEDEKAPRLLFQETEASDDESDDAPEEVGFVASKKNAASLRQQENQAKKQATEALKEQRKRRQRLQKAPEPEKVAATAPDDDGNGDSDQEEDNQDIDMLPDDVLDALVDVETHDRRLMQKRIISEQLRLKRKPKQRKTFSQRQVGPVTVQVLKKGTNKKASEAARAFLSQRLQRGVQRSNEMLQPTKIGGVFVSGPKAT
ncbi:hypothetical protein Ndes2526B_g08707 [Nannochloris sp. 'desiccata']|nr:hypothetical protein NADE_000976 [Chlorella desiccata (nom. nud.)]KAH7616612.1 hypothetical protein NADE_001424 [Chlorella desiccata (nom. nud.)]